MYDPSASARQSPAQVLRLCWLLTVRLAGSQTRYAVRVAQVRAVSGLCADCYCCTCWLLLPCVLRLWRRVMSSLQSGSWSPSSARQTTVGSLKTQAP